jgi:hypothetical protein
MRTIVSFEKKMHNILVSTILANIQYLRESNRSTSAVETCHLEQQRYKLQQKITRSLHKVTLILYKEGFLSQKKFPCGFSGILEAEIWFHLSK